MISICRTDGRRVLGLLCVAALWPLPAVAESGPAETAFQPAGLLAQTGALAIPTPSSGLALDGERLFVVTGTTPEDGRILRLSQSTLIIEAEAPLGLKPDDVLVSPDDGTVFVIGSDVQQTRILVLGPDLSPLGQVMSETGFAHPTLSWAGGGLLAVGDYGADKAMGDFRVVDVSNPMAPVFLPSPRVALAARGVMKAWLDTTLGIAFLNLSAEPSLIAVDAGSDRRVAGSGGQSKSATPLEPFTVDALLSNQRCDGGTDPSFLISDRNRDRLMLVEYVEYFRALNLVTEVEPRLRLRPGAVAKAQTGSGLRPSGLLASSCDRGVIWLGSLYSDEVIQYALNPAAASLEKVGSITLPSVPSALALSPDGQLGIAVMADGTVIGFAAAGNAAESLIGDPSVRELQRLLTEEGYPVGVIDGFLGARTQRAVAMFQTTRGLTLDPEADIDAAVRAIKGIKN